jgi:hypothetical protein
VITGAAIEVPPFTECIPLISIFSLFAGLLRKLITLVESVKSPEALISGFWCFFLFGPLDELRASAPKAYKEIWDSYETGEENGIVTSHYSLIENDDEIFILKRK